MTDPAGRVPHPAHAAADGSPWFRRFHPGPEPAVRLVCLPHAGGTAASWFPFSRDLAAATGGAVQVLAVQYPGRQDRLAEPPLRSLTALADAIHAALLPWADPPPAFLGHSMGAVLAHALARRLERDKDTPAAALLVSGRRAPTAHRPPGTIHLRDDAGLVAELAALGGFPAQVLADAELLRLVLPAVRADYTALETHTHRPGPPLRCPLTVLTGEDDPRVTAAEAAAWQAETTGPFRLHRFPGGHFYLTGQRPAVVRAVAAALGFPA